jgi:acetate---CoA ligase (ADP-forming) subunit beta
MLTKEMKNILSNSKEAGWVLEPEAKTLLSSAGIEVPRFHWATEIEEAIRLAAEIGYPIVGKVVSPRVIHKSEKEGVEVGIKNEEKLRETFDRFKQIEGFGGMLIEEMLSGMELIAGAKVDFQFGPVILFGIGGVWVEIYRDVILKMAPLNLRDIESMMKCLKGRRLLEGYRGSKPVDLKGLERLLLAFSDLVMDLESLMQSIDLNPIICSPTRCVVADARIMLKKSASLSA